MSDSTIDQNASRHKLSRGAVQALADSLARSGGGSAQWNHPDLGGMGQWFAGGMLQIGAMFDDGLKARVAAALEDLAKAHAGRQQAAGTEPESDPPFRGSWWPADLGQPASTGSQNQMHYAWFPDAHRLLVRQDGMVTVYDTGSKRLTGFTQAQGTAQTLEFSGSDGRVTLADLDVIR